MIDVLKFEKQYEDLISKIPDYEVPPSEAKELATKFFKATFEINKVIRIIRNDIILLEQTSKVLYKQAIENSEGKNITEKKVNAEANIQYLKGLKELQEHSNSLEYFRGLFKIMEQGHIFYKGISLDK